MSLFPDIGVAGYGATNGFDPDGGALQKVIAKNMFCLGVWSPSHPGCKTPR